MDGKDRKRVLLVSNVNFRLLGGIKRGKGEKRKKTYPIRHSSDGLPERWEANQPRRD